MSNLGIIGSVNGLSPVQRQAITWTKPDFSHRNTFQFIVVSSKLKQPGESMIYHTHAQVNALFLKWGQHGAHLGPTGPRWAPCWHYDLCYLGRFTYHSHKATGFVRNGIIMAWYPVQQKSDYNHCPYVLMVNLFVLCWHPYKYSLFLYECRTPVCNIFYDNQCINKVFFHFFYTPAILASICSIIVYDCLTTVHLKGTKSSSLGTNNIMLGIPTRYTTQFVSWV